jgi:hypothetical protein
MCQVMLSESDLERFTSKIQYTDTCWLWTGCKRKGYGGFQLNGTFVLAHRLALEIHLGRSLSPGACACHAAHAVCGHRHCVNPEHLREGTPAENAADRVVDGTSRGTRNPKSKLTDHQVLCIRSDARSYRDIAPDYGVGKSTIGYIKSRKTWSHV